MKRFIVGIVCIAVILVGCTDESNANQSSEMDELEKQIEQLTEEKDTLLKTLEEEREARELEIAQEVSMDHSMILAKDIEEYPMTLYKKATLDLDKDGEEEVIELYVNAGKSENGVFGWDDGQTWLLVVKDGENTYPLFHDYVQLGSINFTTTTMDNKPAIVMIHTSHSNKKVQKFIYDNKESGYQKETFYKKENMNDQYNLPASYAFFQDAFDLIKVTLTTNIPMAQEKKNPEEISLAVAPILADVYEAQGILNMVTELNPALHVTLKDIIDLLNDMVYDQPTAEQMDRLQFIHDVFKEINTEQLINQEENEIHPETAEKLQKFNALNR